MNVGIADIVVFVVAVAFWAALIWRGTRVRILGQLWWSCAFLATYVTFKTGVVNQPFNAATGALHLDALIRNLAAVGAAIMTLQWQSWIRHGEARTGLVRRTIAGVVTAAWLIGWWFASPIYAMPLTPYIPRAVDNAPPMLLHWFGFHVFLVVVSVIFIRAAVLEVRELRESRATYIRVSLYLFIGAFGLNLVANGVHAFFRARGFTGSPMPYTLYAPLDLLLIGIYVLILVAIVIPLTRPSRWRRVAASSDEVQSLWTWLRDQPGGESMQAETLLDRVTEIRDRIHELQRWISPAELAHAGRQARLAGLLGKQGLAFMAALCLQVAATAARRGDPIADPPPALLGQLGGGRTIAGESRWFTLVWSCLRATTGRLPA